MLARMNDVAVKMMSCQQTVTVGAVILCMVFVVIWIRSR